MQPSKPGVLPHPAQGLNCATERWLLNGKTENRKMLADVRGAYSGSENDLPEHDSHLEATILS